MTLDGTGWCKGLASGQCEERAQTVQPACIRIPRMHTVRDRFTEGTKRGFKEGSLLVQLLVPSKGSLGGGLRALL